MNLTYFFKVYFQTNSLQTVNCFAEKKQQIDTFLMATFLKQNSR